MSDADQIHRGRLYRVMHAPLGELLRVGPFARRPQPAAIVAAAVDLPSPAKERVARVVKATRLWRRERVDVAHELIAHFTDGLAAGEPLDTLLTAFGDERQAARLIRRAKRRNRSLLWQAWRVLGWTLVALVGLYVAAGLYFAVGRASPSVDYLALLNETALAAPADDRAWPMYRTALLGMKDQGRWPKFLFDDPHGKHGPAIERWLTEHASSVELLRHAAAKPAMGFVLTYPFETDLADRPLTTTMPVRPDERQAIDRRGNVVVGPIRNVVLPHLNELRQAAIVLAADSTLARRQGDADRLERNVIAMMGMSAQLREERSVLVTQLVSMGIYVIALRELERTLLETPHLFDDATWTRLAHRLARVANAADLVSFEGERMVFHDLVQRSYTDDGNGDGRLTPAGIALMTLNAGSLDGRHEAVDLQVYGLGPVLMTSVPGRRAMLAAHGRLMSDVEAALHRPLREFDRDALVRDTIAANDDPYMPTLISIIVPPLTRVQVAAERLLGQCDGVTIAIALELYRRRNGARYPTDLQSLVPALLPAIPTDRITGEPIRYRLLPDGTPLVYSVGDDRDDDGGVPAKGNLGPDANAAAHWSRSASPPDGDWILFPQTRSDPPPPDGATR